MIRTQTDLLIVLLLLDLFDLLCQLLDSQLQFSLFVFGADLSLVCVFINPDVQVNYLYHHTRKDIRYLLSFQLDRFTCVKFFGW